MGLRGQCDKQSSSPPTPAPIASLLCPFLTCGRPFLLLSPATICSSLSTPTGGSREQQTNLKAMQPSTEPPPHQAPCLSPQQADSQRSSSSTSLSLHTAPQRAFPTQCTPRSTLTWLWVKFGLLTHLILLTCWMFLNLSSEDIVHPLRHELCSGLLFPPCPVQCLSESVPT